MNSFWEIMALKMICMELIVCLSQKRELTEKEYNEKCDELDHKYNKQEMPLHLNVFMDEM